MCKCKTETNSDCLKNHICFGLAQGQDPQIDSLSVQKSSISAIGTLSEEVLWISGVSKWVCTVSWMLSCVGRMGKYYSDFFFNGSHTCTRWHFSAPTHVPSQQPQLSSKLRSRAALSPPFCSLLSHLPCYSWEASEPLSFIDRMFYGGAAQELK